MSAERFLVDTTVWVRYLRGGDEALRERLAPLALEDRATTCEIVILEILRGARTDKEFKMLRDLFLALPLLALNREVWELAWRNSHLLRKKGLNVPLADVILAAVAQHHRCTLLHGDRHFELIARHTDVKATAV